MNIDDLKKYSVIVENGSGCLFQPMDESYTYILTAKHLFIKEEKDKGQGKQEIQLPDGSDIKIKRFVKSGDNIKEDIPCTLKEGETYFPHKDADIAILKITPKIDGFENICPIEYTEIDSCNEFLLNGYPTNFNTNDGEGEKYTNQAVQRIVSSNKFSITAQLRQSLDQNYIDGFSGGAIAKTDNSYIQLAGIQSKMANKSNYQPGQIAFVPIKHFNEIVEYEEYKGKLSKLLPPYMKKFDFLLDDCFALEVDAIDKPKAECIKMTLRNKAVAITKSDITPIGIKELFKNRLLINEKESSCLSHKKIWISWLEFLVIMNLMKYENINAEMLTDIFDTHRLKYSDAHDWTGIFRTDLLVSDYIGLKEDSIVFVNTRNAPKRTQHLLIPKGKMPITIGRVYEKRGFQTDKGLDPYTSFNFVHLDYFKTKCIIEKLEEYQKLNEDELLIKLKCEYNELFK